MLKPGLWVYNFQGPPLLSSFTQLPFVQYSGTSQFFIPFLLQKKKKKKERLAEQCTRLLA